MEGSDSLSNLSTRPLQSNGRDHIDAMNAITATA